MSNAAFQIRLPPSGPVAKDMTPGYVLTVQSDGTHVAAAPGGGGGGAVSSVFGRTGAVVAVAGDYTSSQVTNASGVAGGTVTAALNALAAAIPSVPVSSVFGRTGAVVAVAGDYTSSQVTNASSVAGGTVTAALNTLQHNSGTVLFNAGPSGAAITIDFAGDGKFQQLTLTADCTLSLTPPAVAGTVLLRLVQNGTGNHAVTWPVSVAWPGGTAPTITQPAGSRDLVALFWDGTGYDAVDTQDLR